MPTKNTETKPIPEFVTITAAPILDKGGYTVTARLECFGVYTVGTNHPHSEDKTLAIDEAVHLALQQMSDALAKARRDGWNF